MNTLISDMASRLIVYCYEKTLKAHLLAVVTAVDKDHNREIPQLAILCSGCSSYALPAMDTSLIASCCSPVESELQQLALLGDGRSGSGRGSGRLMMVSWALHTEEDDRIEVAAAERILSPMERMNEGRVVVWCSELELLISLGGESVEEFSLNKYGCWRRVVSPMEECFLPDVTMKRQKSSARCSPSCIRGPEAVAIGPHIYMVGGTYRSAVDWTWRYNARERSWEELAAMTTKRQAFGLCHAGQYLIAVGGNNGCETLASIEVYDIKADRWVTSYVTLTKPREKLKVTLSGGFLIICGGVDKNERRLRHFEGTHLRDVLQATVPTPCSICELPIEGVIIAMSYSLYTDRALHELQLRSLPPPTRKPVGVPSAPKTLWNGSATQDSPKTAKSAKTKVFDLKKTALRSAELQELPTATSESSEGFEFVSEEREPDYCVAKAVQQPPPLASLESVEDAARPPMVETPPFVTPREVTWADEASQSLVTIFEPKTRSERRAPKKIREIHTRGVQTDDAYHFRNYHILTDPHVPNRRVTAAKPSPSERKQRDRFIDPITFYYF